MPLSAALNAHSLAGQHRNCGAVQNRLQGLQTTDARCSFAVRCRCLQLADAVWPNHGEKVPAHVLVSKNPVVSWWDVSCLQKDPQLWVSTLQLSACQRAIRQASLERWSSEGISEITWEEVACRKICEMPCILRLNAQVHICAGHPQDLLLHCPTCIIFHHPGTPLIHCQCCPSAHACQERHIDLPYKHWNMRCPLITRSCGLIGRSEPGHATTSRLN